MAKNSCQKVPKSDFQSQFLASKIIQIFQIKFSLKNINLGAPFLFLSILCSIKIEQFLFLKFLKKLAFFDSYFWPFNNTNEKIIAIFVISAIIPSIWNVFFIKFCWHDEKLTQGLTTILADKEIQDFESFMNRFAPIKWYLERIDAKQIIKNWTYLVETKMWRARHEHTKKIIEQLFNENHGCDLNQKLEDLQLL